MTTIMRSIYRLIDQLPEDKWNYYSVFQNLHDRRKPFVTDLSSRTFIEQFFNFGGKGDAMLDFSLASFGSPRADHTVSIYFLSYGLSPVLHTMLHSTENAIHRYSMHAQH